MSSCSAQTRDLCQAAGEAEAEEILGEGTEGGMGGGEMGAEGRVEGVMVVEEVSSRLFITFVSFSSHHQHMMRAYPPFIAGRTGGRSGRGGGDQ